MSVRTSNRIDICGARVDPVSMDGAVDRIGSMIASRGTHLVVTPNVDHVVKLERDPAFRGVYARASLVLADGMPLVLASRLLGTPLPGRVTGSDLFVELAARASREGWRLYFLGGNPGDADRARDALVRRHPRLQVVGTCCPDFGFEKDPAFNRDLVARIRDAAPDVLLVGLGAPKQEFWLAGHLAATGVPVGVGIGISFSFVAGTVRRAPRPLQRLGLEWSWRLAMEPKRLWRRYLLEDSRFALLVARQWLRTRRPVRARAH